MPPSTRILMIGTYLSKDKGSKSISEKIAPLLANDCKIILKSHYKNKLLRIIDIAISTCFFRYDKIHIDVFSDLAFFIAEVTVLLARVRRKKIYLTLRGGKLAEFELEHSTRVSKVLNQAIYIQTPSLFLKEYFEGKGFQIHYLPNLINLEHFPYKRDSVKPFSLLWVRAFTPIYQPDLAVILFDNVRKKYPLATLTMVGPDKGNLEEVFKLIDRLGLRENITITGPVPNEKLYQYYNAHEVYLNTTIYESFGVAIVEAAACGIPIVSTDVGEIPYLWTHEENILLVNDFEATSFVQQVFRIFEDKELAKKLSVNANLKAQSFDWGRIKPLWIKLLTE